MLSTILFIDNTPVGYEVSKQEETLFFQPTKFTAKSCCPPIFSVTLHNEKWVIEPEIADTVKHQVLQDIELLRAGNLLR